MGFLLILVSFFFLPNVAAKYARFSITRKRGDVRDGVGMWFEVQRLLSDPKKIQFDKMLFVGALLAGRGNFFINPCTKY